MVFLFAELNDGKKKTSRSSQDSNLGPLNSGQILLPMSYWSSGIGAEDRWYLSIDTAQVSGWISPRLGKLCMISAEVLCAATSELGNSSSYSVCVPSEFRGPRFESWLDLNVFFCQIFECYQCCTIAHCCLRTASVCFSLTPCVNSTGTTLIGAPACNSSSGRPAMYSRASKNCIVRASLGGKWSHTAKDFT